MSAVDKVRKIKFRGKSSGVWRYGSLLLEEGSNPKIVVTQTEWYTVAPKSIGEFTGNTDRDGKEIYEGDVVEINNKKRFHIKWGEWGFGGHWVTEELDRLGGPMSQYPQFMFTNKKGKAYVIVVGNSYDTPNLLKEK